VASNICQALVPGGDTSGSGGGGGRGGDGDAGSDMGGGEGEDGDVSITELRIHPTRPTPDAMRPWGERKHGKYGLTVGIDE